MLQHFNVRLKSPKTKLSLKHRNRERALISSKKEKEKNSHLALSRNFSMTIDFEKILSRILNIN